MNRMTVKELIEKLSKFDENMIVDICGGESSTGECAELAVGKMVNRPWVDYKGEIHNSECFDLTEVIMEYGF